MTTIVTRAGKGAALTHNEVDANFVNLNTDKIEANDTVTLTNKTLTNPVLSEAASGTTSGRLGFSSGALSFGDGSAQRTVATTDGTQTLTNKTLTGGTVNPTTLQENGVAAVVQTDIGTAPNEIPLNQYLGSLAYQDSDAIAGPVAIGANSDSDALRITQTGTGNALVVEDSANPDSTPFVIDASGVVVAGTTAAYNSGTGTFKFQSVGDGTSAQGFATFGWANSATFNPRIEFAKSRSGIIGTHTIVQSGDTIGQVNFNGSDGAAFIQAASITAAVDGAPGTNDMPGRLVFSTTADGASSPTERMRIDSAGNVGIGGSSFAGVSFRNTKSITGATSAFANYTDATVSSGVTSIARGYSTYLTTQAASFTLPTLSHYEAASNTFGAGSTVTNQFGFIAQSSLTGATNNYGFYSNIASGTGRWNFYANGTAANYFAGTIASLGSYNQTTAAAANLTIDSSGNISRSTSSIRYKKDVETLDSSYADAVVFGARPVWYRSKSENDNANWGWYGLIAEELAEIDPRLVHWGYPTKTVEHEPAVEAKAAVFDDDGNEIEPAVEAKAATFKEVPDTDAELQAEGVQYERLTVLLLDVVKRQNESIKALEARIAALEGV